MSTCIDCMETKETLNVMGAKPWYGVVQLCKDCLKKRKEKDNKDNQSTQERK